MYERISRYSAMVFIAPRRPWRWYRRFEIVLKIVIRPSVRDRHCVNDEK